ncbi:DNA-formamidopyrimidine glycosylase family protein [Corynebacterium glyciniphilum]|uniref:DNA-formamidopyrimidine glycosylase family protein n=1 Tax=Corynebacterium glyciniphilum TaxID=1404244 RepID=UPI00264FAD03|nr:DNA-formamidopyrimidine glycosylase family protein [Corynebacterium glyciniphilum]MDN5682229.1 Fpg/Nei family DNA glycosylase [Corynebacterium glyciniphilum]MDN6705487.1 Fpg/Nei family DNA glycosylase [Corynebacterium glyciniphilum]
MPESPDVEAVAFDLRRRLAGRVVDRVDLTAFSALKTVAVAPSSLVGKTVTDVRRHGKFLDLQMDDVHLIMHLARAGWVTWRDSVSATRPKPGKGPLAVRLVLGDGCLDVTEAGTKKRLALYLVNDPAEVTGVAALGVDPVAPDFTFETFCGVLDEAGRARIKGVLRDQTLVAGIGNAYSDEILHRARMSPFTSAAMVPELRRQLYDAVVETLTSEIRRLSGFDAADIKQAKKDGMQAHGRAGQPCPVCGDTVRQVVFSDSSFQYCPTCQTGGQVLADRGMSRLLK